MLSEYLSQFGQDPSGGLAVWILCKHARVRMKHVSDLVTPLTT